MPNLIITILFICTLHFSAGAVMMYPAIMKDPKKAEETLIERRNAKKLFVAKRRGELKKKHALYLSAKAKTKVVEKAEPGDSLQTNASILESPKDAEIDSNIRVTNDK